MNTAELKKLAEAATVWDSKTYHEFYAVANPAAILKLLAINGELVEALKLIAETDPVDAALDPQRAVRVACAALAKTEGGEL